VNSEELKATAQVMAQSLVAIVLDLINADPHRWSSRPCPTCRAISITVGKPFGCVAVSMQG
jgi:hypothetical protein